MSCLNIKLDLIFEFLWIFYCLRLCIQLSSFKFSSSPWHRRKTHISRYCGWEQLILTNFFASWTMVGTPTQYASPSLLAFTVFPGRRVCLRHALVCPGPYLQLPKEHRDKHGKECNLQCRQCRQSHGMGELGLQGLHQLWRVSLLPLFLELTEGEFKETNDLGLSSLTGKQGISGFPWGLGLHL